MCSWVLRGACWKSWRETLSREGVNLCPKKLPKFHEALEGTPSFADERVPTALGSCYRFTSSPLAGALLMSLAWLGEGLISCRRGESWRPQQDRSG